MANVGDPRELLIRRRKVTETLSYSGLSEIAINSGLEGVIGVLAPSPQVSINGNVYRIKVSDTFEGRPVGEVDVYQRRDAMINRLMDLGITAKADKGYVNADAGQLRTLLMPIILAKPEERKALLEQLWERRDAEGQAPDDPRITTAEQQAGYLQTLLAPAIKPQAVRKTRG